VAATRETQRVDDDRAWLWNDNRHKEELDGDGHDPADLMKFWRSEDAPELGKSFDHGVVFAEELTGREKASSPWRSPRRSTHCIDSYTRACLESPSPRCD
jgi:hypothetical protein